MSGEHNQEGPMKKYDYNRSVEPCRAVVLRAVLGERVFKSTHLEAETWARRVIRETGVSGSVNQFGLAICSGHALGLVSNEELVEWVAGELRCSWFRKGCGIANEQGVNATHGALNTLNMTYAAKAGIPGAEEALGRTFRLILEVDPWKTGKAIACGARSADQFRDAKQRNRIPSADFGDRAAEALRGDRLNLSKQPSSQDAVAVIQRDFPHIIANAAGYQLPPLLYPMTIEQRDGHILVTSCPSAPKRQTRYGVVTPVWYAETGGRVEAWGYEEAVPDGEVLSSVTTPQGVTE